MTGLTLALVAPVALLALLTFPREAAADDDGVYGRLAGDLDVRAGAGISFSSGGPSVAASAAVVYLQTGGFYVHYADAAGSDAPLARRSISTGIHLQPIFLARYASDAERGPAHLDLFIDSFAVELGAAWTSPRLAAGSTGPGAASPGTFDPEPGLELGLTMSVPILPRASGPHLDLRGALRWRGGDLRGPAGADAFERGALFSVTLAWHQVVGVHIVDVGDAVRR